MSAVAQGAVDKAVQLASDFSSEAMKALWDVFLKDSDFFEEVSLFSAGFSGLFLIAFFIAQEANKKRAADNQINLVLELKDYFLIGAILACLAAPQVVGAGLWGIHDITNTKGAALIAQLSKVSGDPNKAFAKIEAEKAIARNSVKTCEGSPNVDQRKQCEEDVGKQVRDNIFNIAGAGLELTGNPLGTVGGAIARSSDPLGNPLDGLGEGVLLTLLIPVLVLLGTGFQIILELGQVVSAILFPSVLLVGIYSFGFVLKWIRSFLSWGLINFSYKVIVSGVGFLMLQTHVFDTGLYAVVIAFLAPWAAFQVVSGSTLGIFSGAGAALRLIARR
jgi:hypothetical protein